MPEMSSRADVIFKFKDIFIRRRNEDAAVRLQSLLRGAIQRRKYLRERSRRSSAATTIQAFVRMRWVRTRYLRFQLLRRESAAIVCQKLLKGYMTFRRIKNLTFARLDAAVDHLTSLIDRMTLR